MADVALTPDLIDLNAPNVSEDRLQRRQVAVDVPEDSDSQTGLPPCRNAEELRWTTGGTTLTAWATVAAPGLGARR